MSILLLTIVTVIYILAALDEAVSGKPHMALVLGGYALANCGLIWGMR